MSGELPAKGSWCRIVDTAISGRVITSGATGIPWVVLETPRGQIFDVPLELVSPCEEPAVEYAAHQILDMLAAVDRSWSITDTTEIRRRLVLRVRAALNEYEERNR